MGLDQWCRQIIATYSTRTRSPTNIMYTPFHLGHYLCFHHLAATFQSQRRVTLPDSFQSHAVLQATTAGGSGLNVSTSQLSLGLTTTGHCRITTVLVVQTVLQLFSKFLQLPVTTASTVLAKQTAEFKSFCNLIGWHGSRSCSLILQELRKNAVQATAGSTVRE